MGFGRKGQFSITLPTDILDELKRQADAEDVSVAHVIRRIIKEALAKEDKTCTG